MIYVRKVSLWIFIAVAIATGVPTPWIPNPALAKSNPAVQTIIAQGVGKDVESAAKNAAENALTQVVGTFIQSDKILNKRTEINNGIRQESRSIDTKTREYSQGSIKAFELLETSQDNGLVRVSARVEVRIEDFKAFITKLAEGEAALDVGTTTQVEIQAKKRQNALDILVDDILLPVAEGKAIDFHVGKPQVLSEWEQTSDQRDLAWKRPRYRNFVTPDTLVLPIRIEINGNFISNARQLLDSIAISKIRIKSGYYVEERVVDQRAEEAEVDQERRFGFTPGRDAALEIVSNDSSLSEMYFVKDVTLSGTQKSSSLRDLLASEAFAPFTLSNEFEMGGRVVKLLPKMQVTFYGDDRAAIKEVLLAQAGWRAGRTTSTDRSVFSIQPFRSIAASLHSVTLIKSKKFEVFINLPIETLTKVKTIGVKLVGE